MVDRLSAPAPIMRCEELTKAYGGVHAVQEVSLDVPQRGVHGLCGFNGAGKSTLFNLLAGSVRADSGRVWLEDRDISRTPAVQRARMGIARTWQIVRLAEDRTVLDNVAVGCLGNPGQTMLASLFRSQLPPARERAAAVLDRLGLGHLRGEPAGRLTLEGQRLTELARAVASEPKVLLTDEPASGLSATQRSVLSDVLTLLGEERAVVVVEHDLDMLMTICDDIRAMVNGRLVFTGSVEDFAASEVYTGLRGISMADKMRASDRRSG